MGQNALLWCIAVGEGIYDALPFCALCGAGINEPHKEDCKIAPCSVCGGCRIRCNCSGHDPQKVAYTEDSDLCFDVLLEEYEERKANRPPPKAGSLAPESEGLEPLRASGITIGSYSDINGPDAVLVDFLPTRAELKTLAYHYLDSAFAVEMFFVRGGSGSREIREHPFCWGRFNAIADALGPDPIKEFEDYIAAKSAEVEKFRRCFEAHEAAGEKPRAPRRRKGKP